MAVKAVTVVSVPVSDQDRAKAFYVDELGFDLVRDESAPDIRWVQVAPKGSPVSLTLVTWFESMPAGSLQGLVLTSTDLAADYGAMTANGVEFEHPPQEQPWASSETVLHDPDGNSLVLQQA